MKTFERENGARMARNFEVLLVVALVLSQVLTLGNVVAQAARRQPALTWRPRFRWRRQRPPVVSLRRRGRL